MIATVEQIPTEIQAAEAALNKILAGRTLPDGSALGATLNLGIKARTETWGPREPEVKETLDIAIDAPRSGTTPVEVANTINKALAELPAFKNHVQFESDAQHATKLKETLKDLIGKGADLPQNYLEWGGFKSDVAEQDGWRSGLDLHALRFDKHTSGITVNIIVPLDKSERENSRTIIDGIKNNIEGRLEDIRKLLAARLAKYNGVTDEAGKAELQNKVNALVFDIGISEYNEQSNYRQPAQINIKIASPEQVEAGKDPNKLRGLSAEEEKALAATNVLDKLPMEKLGKALGRSFLHAGDTANDIFPKIAGREDMKRAIIKSLVRLKTAKPETAQEVDALLADDTFKNQDLWSQTKEDKENKKSRPTIVTVAQDGKLHIQMDMAPGKAFEIVKALGAMEAPKQEQPATAIVEPKTTMGAALPPAAQAPELAAAVKGPEPEAVGATR